MTTLTLVNIDVELLPEDGPLLIAAIARAKQYENADRHYLYLTSRRADGWLEFGLGIERHDGKCMQEFYLGCIQRSVGAECEFHS